MNGSLIPSVNAEARIPDEARGPRLARLAAGDWALRLLLAGLVAYAFSPALGNGFADTDDIFNFESNGDYRGLGTRQIAWAWRATLLGVYQPLSWMLLSAQYAVWG